MAEAETWLWKVTFAAQTAFVVDLLWGDLVHILHDVMGVFFDQNTQQIDLFLWKIFVFCKEIHRNEQKSEKKQPQQLKMLRIQTTTLC